MWIQHPNGVVVLVHNDVHIKRILGEGGYEVPDPRIAHQPQESVLETPEQQESEQDDGSQSSNEPTDSASQAHDRRPGRRKSAVRGQ